MARSKRFATALLACLVCLAGGSIPAQDGSGHEQGLPDPVPPPLPRKPPPKTASGYEPLIEASDLPWGLADDLLDTLFEQAAVYRDYTRRFDCTESARLAEYDGYGEVTEEKTRRYGYLLLKDPEGDEVREFRQALAKDGSIKKGEVKDDEPFPPAYAWVFLFSRFNEPYFSYRSLGDRFDGFDWVHEIQFRGSLPFTDGKDIRQWEGVVLIDAVTHTPLEIRAEPTGQFDRIEALYRRWQQSFNIMGWRVAPKPLGFRALIQFRHRREGLTFPTELRYDTFRSLGSAQTRLVHASIRNYKDYRIFTGNAVEVGTGLQ